LASDRLRPDKVGRPRKVLLDSSFLIAVMEHPTPWREDITDKIGGFDPVVIGPVYSELERIAGGRGRGARFASVAKELADSGSLKVEETGGDTADDELISKALDDGALVATVDAALIRQLKAARVGVIRLRGGRVELDGTISQKSYIRHSERLRAP
jgi:rRNA-processing protein FCF1